MKAAKLGERKFGEFWVQELFLKNIAQIINEKPSKKIVIGVKDQEDSVDFYLIKIALSRYIITSYGF